MPTEASIYEEHLTRIIRTLEVRVASLENSDELSAADEIELTALDVLLERLDALEDYDGSGS